MSVRTECLEGEAALHALEPEWNPLLEQSAGNALFLRFEWVATWWEVFGPAFRPFVLAARDEEGRLVGLAPLMIGRGPGPYRRGFRHLMLVGQQGDTLAEHLDFIAPAGREEQVTPHLVEAMLERRERWDVLLFERVPDASPHLPLLERGFAARGLDLRRREASPSPYLPLPGSFEDLLAAKSRNFRRQWRNSANRLAREGTVRVRLAGRDVELDEAFGHLVRLHRARWGERGGSFRTEAYLRFHRALSRKLLEADALLLALLEVGGQVVGARYDFVHAGKVWCFQSGWLPEYERMRVGTVLLGHVLDHAIGRGLSEYDFLSGEEDYKSRWATAARMLVDVEGTSSTVRARLFRAARRVRTVLRPGRTGG